MTCQIFASGLILRTGSKKNNPKEVGVAVSFLKEREYSLSNGVTLYLLALDRQGKRSFCTCSSKDAGTAIKHVGENSNEGVYMRL